MQNYLVVIQQFDKICISSKGMQKKKKSQLHCESPLARKGEVESQICYLTSRGRGINCKMREIGEVTMIYRDIKTEGEPSRWNAKEILCSLSKKHVQVSRRGRRSPICAGCFIEGERLIRMIAA